MMPTEAFLDEEPPPSSKAKRSSKKLSDESHASSKKSSSKKHKSKTKEDDDRSSLKRAPDDVSSKRSSKRSSTKDTVSSTQMCPSKGYSEEEASSREKKKKKKKSKDGKSNRSSKGVKASSSKDRSKSSSPESIPEEEDVKIAPVLAGLAPISRFDSADFTIRKEPDVALRWDRFESATKTPQDDDGFDDSCDSSNQFSAGSIASGFSMPILPRQSSHSLSQRRTRPLPPGLVSPSRPGAVAVSNTSERIQDMMDRKFNSIEEQKEEEGEAMPEVVVGAHRATALPARIQNVLDRKFDQFASSGIHELVPSQEEGRIHHLVQEKMTSFPSSCAASSRRIDQHLSQVAVDDVATEESIEVQPTAAMTFTAWNYGEGSERYSVRAPPPGFLTNHLIDDQDFALSGIERKEMRLAAGLCAECGRTQTHEKIKYGPFQAFRRMEPLTTPGQVYKGYCLYCNNIFDLRKYLHEPYLREQDLAGTTSAALVEEAPINMPSSDESVQEFTPKTRGFQICLCIGVLAVIIGFMGLVISFVSTANVSQVTGPEQTVAPTAAPGPLGFHQMGAEISEPVLSFGYKVAISADGNRVAVSSPKVLNGTGRTDIFNFDESKNWVSVGSSILGDSVGDRAGFGMDLSDDGESVVLGYPGNGYGFVRVFRYVYGQNQWQQVGSTLVGEISGGRFGASVAINPDGSHIIVGAPSDTNDNGEKAGCARVYRLGTDEQWVQVGSDLLGSAASDMFGTSVAISDDGKRVAVGAPNNDDRNVDGGQVHVFLLDEDIPDESPIWVELLDEMKIVGDLEAHRFGTVMSMNGRGDTVVSSAINADNDEGIEGGGDPRVVFVESDFGGGELGYGLPAIPGTIGLGCSVDIDFDGTIVVASTLNNEGHAGKAMVYNIKGSANWFSYPPGEEFGGEELGPSNWLGQCPSVSLSSMASHFAIGYESIIDSKSREPRPVVRVYYYGHDEA